MAKTTALTTAKGNYDVAATCPKGHKVYKKRGDTNPYVCPECGHTIN